MSPQIKAYKFGDFTLDCTEEMLLSGGETVALTPKALKVLRLLVENPGRVVDKQELLDVVWADSFVEEGNVPFTVNRLRKALGDSSAEPQFIETVPRRGYRFIAPVEVIEELQEEDPASVEERLPTAINEVRSSHATATEAPGQRSLLVPLFSAIALILLASAIWLAMKSGRDTAAPILSKPFLVQPLSTSGNTPHAAISPDGRYAAYTEESGGLESVWLRNLDSSENIQIVPPTSDDYLGLTYSNEGRHLYFVRKPEDVHALPAVYRVEAIGGIPTKLIDNAVQRPALSNDDKQIAFVRCRFRRDDFCSAWVADADGKNERKLITTENGVHIWDLRFSPDDKSLAVAKGRFANDRNDAGVFEVDVATGAEKEMFGKRFFEVLSTSWLPDGSGLLFAASDFRDGKASIWKVDRATNELSVVSKDAASYAKVSLDQVGDKLIAVQQLPDFRINSLEGSSSRTFSVARDMAVSRSGKVVYSTFDGEVWSMNRDGTGQRQLSNTEHAEFSLCVSPDDKAIFFSSDEGGVRQIWRMNSDGTERKQLTTDAGGFPSSVSGDGQFVFFTAAIGGGVYRVPAEGGEVVMLHEKPLVNPVVSPDGRFAAHFVIENMSRKIAIMDLHTKENVKLIGVESGHYFGRPVAWSGDGQTLYYIVGKGGANVLWRRPMGSEASEKMADLQSGEILSISNADDGTFTYISGKWRFDVVLVEGLGVGGK